jgi:thiamine kinase-like enzyme
MHQHIKQIASLFVKKSSELCIEPFGNGHINNTYRITNDSNTSWLLQKINKSVFTEPEILVNNHHELIRNYDFSNEIEIPVMINENSDSHFFVDKYGEYWRMFNFINETKSIENITNEKQAVEAGRAYGSFLLGCKNCRIECFKEPIPNFHSISHRFQQFKEAISLDQSERLYKVKDIIGFYKNYYNTLQTLEQAIAKTSIPMRIVHNDTKINNLLFRNDKAVAVVDLDTTGPGTVLYDYGDALRTLANETYEDDKNLKNVKFSIKWFSAFTKGYLKQTKSILTELEKEILWQSPFLMTFIMGIRFLTDYLNGDVYYKTKYDNHNLVRAEVQKALLEDMTKKKDQIKHTIDYLTHNL